MVKLVIVIFNFPAGFIFIFLKKKSHGIIHLPGNTNLLIQEYGSGLLAALPVLIELYG